MASSPDPLRLSKREINLLLLAMLLFIQSFVNGLFNFLQYLSGYWSEAHRFMIFFNTLFFLVVVFFVFSSVKFSTLSFIFSWPVLHQLHSKSREIITDDLETAFTATSNSWGSPGYLDTSIIPILINLSINRWILAINNYFNSIFSTMNDRDVLLRKQRLSIKRV